MPPNIYMLSFDRKARYEVYYNSELVDEGTFSDVNNTENLHNRIIFRKSAYCFVGK